MRTLVECCVSLVVVLSALAAACAPGVCSEAESHCVDAHTIESCAGSVDAVGASRHSGTTTCPSSTPYCVDTSSATGGTSATCAASSEKSAVCAATPNGQQCVDGQPVTCEAGYLFTQTPCDADHICVVGPRTGYALCALSAAPDPSCTGQPNENVCDGDALLNCYDGFLLAKTLCVGACDTELNECDSVADAGAGGG